MKLSQIKNSAKSKDVYEKINWDSTKFVYIKCPKKLLEALKEYEFVFFGTGDIKNFDESLFYASHAEDYLAQLKNVTLPRPRLRRYQKPPKEE